MVIIWRAILVVCSVLEPVFGLFFVYAIQLHFMSIAYYSLLHFCLFLWDALQSGLLYMAICTCSYVYLLAYIYLFQAYMTIAPSLHAHCFLGINVWFSLIVDSRPSLCANIWMHFKSDLYSLQILPILGLRPGFCTVS